MAYEGGPLGATPAIADRLSVGVGPLRWSDTPALLLSRYPNAQPIQVRHARHPHTGRPVVLTVGYRVTGLISDDDLWRVTFDDDLLTSLEWQAQTERSDWRKTEQSVERMLAMLADRLGFAPIADLHTGAIRVIDDVRIEYAVEGDLYLINIAPLSMVATAEPQIAASA